jgi:hypothetical protein
MANPDKYLPSRIVTMMTKPSLRMMATHRWTCLLLLLLSPSLAWLQMPSTLTRKQSYTHCKATSPTESTPSADPRYYSFLEAPVLTPQSTQAPPVTLNRYLEAEVKKNPELRDLESLLLAVKMACKTISNLVNRAGLVWDPSLTQNNGTTTTTDTTEGVYSDGRYYSMKRLDQLSTLVLKNALKYTGKCHVVAPAVVLSDSEKPAQHQPGVLIAKSLETSSNSNCSYVACLDPLDGSGNADASICTGTVFGVFQQENVTTNGDEENSQLLIDSILQPAKNMRAAGYWCVGVTSCASKNTVVLFRWCSFSLTCV